MEKQACSFVEKICGVNFIVNLKPSEEAKKTAEEFVKALIFKESMALKADCT